MCRFLRLVVTAALEGRSDELKEYRLGVEVFDREEAFDPAVDPIVRVEARRLRTKLAAYYSADGRHDEVLIELPKGGYTPAFRKREETSVSPAQGTPNRMAVLPFVDLSTNHGASSFADGLTWELIHALTRLQRPRVVAWNSAAQLRTEGPADLAEIRKKLGVDMVLTGSIRTLPDRLRVVAQMIDTSSGVYLWSETYERRVDEAADIQQQISDAIIARLRIRFGCLGSSHCAPTSYNPEAYQRYLQGRGLWNQRTESGLRAALESFQQAVALDSQFARAYAGVADAYVLLAEHGFERPAHVMTLARTAAMRALEIDPSLGEAHCSLGLLVTFCDWKWAEAEAHFRLALDLNPGYATSHHWFGCDFLPALGRLEEAMREVEIALTLDPLSPIIGESKAFLLMLQGRNDEAEAHLRCMLDANPSLFRPRAMLGRVLMQSQRYEEAIKIFEDSAALANVPSMLGAFGQACGLSGDAVRARQILARLEAMRRQSYAPATALALTCLGLGEIEKAISWLEEGVRRHEPNVVLIGIHPAYYRLRGDPRFEKLITQDLQLRD